MIVVTGAAEAQAAILKIIQSLGANGALPKAIQAATEVLRQGTAQRAHVDTGTYAGAQELDYANLLGRVYTGDARNPISGEAASTYAPYEEARGGGHAAYQQTYGQDSAKALDAASATLLAALP
jgi:hypothetical protein